MALSRPAMAAFDRGWRRVIRRWRRAVRLAAKPVAPVASYYWEHSLDQETWTPVPETLQARTTIDGLPWAKVAYFRFRALTRTGKGDYSQVVSLLVQ